jgi:phosphoglycerate dehydrogenase-like enzyme
MAQPEVRVLLSTQAAGLLGERVQGALPGRVVQLLRAEEQVPGSQADVAFVSRDVTGLSTKQQLLPSTRHFHDLMRQAPGLQWVQTHAAGADRPVFGELRARCVAVATSSGANAAVVAQSAVAGLLVLARSFLPLMAAQRERRWAPLLASGLPRDLAGQTAVIVGWGPVGQHIARVLESLGLKCVAVRREAGLAASGVPAVAFEDIDSVLPVADWLVLACPLTVRTRGLIGAPRLALLPSGAQLINVARGEVVVQTDLIDALQAGRLAGAHLDVFDPEPLPPDSPLWDMPQVLVTPHAAGHSDGNEARVADLFLDNLRRWGAGEPLLRLVD